jgi:hypothetical protein
MHMHGGINLGGDVCQWSGLSLKDLFFSVDRLGVWCAQRHSQSVCVLLDIRLYDRLSSRAAGSIVGCIVGRRAGSAAGRAVATKCGSMVGRAARVISGSTAGRTVDSTVGSRGGIVVVNTVQYNTVQYSIVLYSRGLYSIVFCTVYVFMRCKVVQYEDEEDEICLSYFVLIS